MKIKIRYERELDISSVVVDGVRPRDYPDFADAFVIDAQWEDGTELTEQELEVLNSDYPEVAQERALDRFT